LLYYPPRWKDLPEPKHFLMVPNAEHSLATGILEVVPVVGTWILHLLKKTPIPTFKWDISETNGDIKVVLDPKVGEPLHVNLWTANTCSAVARRDYRFLTADNPCECGVYTQGTCLNTKVGWSQTRLSPTHIGGFTYVGHVEPPTEKNKWVASFIDVTYKQDPSLSRPDGGIPFTKPGHLEFTSEVSIWPREFPFDDCSGVGCYGTLV